MTPAAAAPRDATADVYVASQVLGDLDVPPSQIYTFADGLYGFAGAERFALLPSEREGLFWLQSLDFEALTFLLIDPFRFVQDYSVELDRAELAELAPNDASEILVLAILTLPKTQEQPATANLRGPIVVNVVERRGKQMALESAYGLHHPVDLRANSDQM